jgi:large subunit ribosomal protein L15
MVNLSTLKPASGATHRRKIVGRGGCHGRSSTRGGKGQTARSGDKSMNGFEGGQTPLVRLIPKSGFVPLPKVKTEIVSVGLLEKHFSSGETVDKKALFVKGLIKNENSRVKILGDGKISKKLTVSADGFSESAVKKITASGGEIKKAQ